MILATIGPPASGKTTYYKENYKDFFYIGSDKIREELLKMEKEKVKEWAIIKNTANETASAFLYEKTKRNPIFLPIVMEV